MSEREQMKLDMVKALANIAMEKNPQLSMEKALAMVINADIYRLLNNEKTALYYQSPRYVYSFLMDEMNTGGTTRKIMK